MLPRLQGSEYPSRLGRSNLYSASSLLVLGASGLEGRRDVRFTILVQLPGACVFISAASQRSQSFQTQA